MSFLRIFWCITNEDSHQNRIRYFGFPSPQDEIYFDRFLCYYHFLLASVDGDDAKLRNSVI